MIATHAAASAWWVPLMFAIYDVPVFNNVLAVLVGGTIGTILPDIDNTKSIAGKIAPGLSRRLESRFGHRKELHSLEFMFAFGAVLWLTIFLFEDIVKIVIPNPQYVVLAYVAAFHIHIMADIFTMEGVMISAILKKMFAWPLNPSFRVIVGTRREKMWLRSFLFIAMASWVVFGIGWFRILYIFTNRPFAAISLISQDIESKEYLIKITGKWLESGTPYEDYAVVVSLDNDYNNMILHPPGRPTFIYSAYCRGTTTKSASLFAEKIKIVKSQKRRLVQENIILQNRFLYSQNFPENAYLRGQFAVRANRTLLRKLMVYTMGDWKILRYKEEKDGSHVYELNYFPVSEFSRYLPLNVLSANLEIIYRE